MSVITCSNVSKQYPIHESGDEIPQVLGESSSVEGKAVFYALNDISFSLDEGSILGIVGRNGAGKSTLLNLIAGIGTPTSGTMSVQGAVAGLFDLQMGFQDELSGKENIFLNGSLHGMRNHEIQEQYGNIVAFSELEDFIHQPLGSYSNGMRLRLGFSIAMHQAFDVFVIDEILMVGDGAFQQKCFEQLAEFRRAGKTMVITSQELPLVERLSDEVMLLESGRIHAYGAPQQVIEEYRKVLSEKRPLHMSASTHLWSTTKWWADAEEEWGARDGTKEVAIAEVEFASGWDRHVSRIKTGDPLDVCVTLDIKEDVTRPHFGIALFRDDRVYCYGPNTKFAGLTIETLRAGRQRFELRYHRVNLMPGRYFFSIAVWDTQEKVPYDYIKGGYAIDVSGENPNRQLLHLDSRIKGKRLSKKPDARAGALFSAAPVRSEVDGVSLKRTIAVRCLNGFAEKRKTFLTGESMQIEMIYDRALLKRFRKCLIWVGIFRSDSVFCFARTLTRKSKEAKTILEFPRLQLLPGGYYISVGVWDEAAQTFSFFQHTAAHFNMQCCREDHGTVYIEHTWKLKV